MTNLFGSLDIGIWNFLEIWCLKVEMSEVLKTRDIVSKDCPSIVCSTVKFHTRGSGFKERIQSFNPEPVIPPGGEPLKLG